MRRLRSHLSSAALRTFYLQYVRPTIEYSDVAWSSLTKTQSDRLERLQRRAARITLGLSLYNSQIKHSELLGKVKWPTLSSRRSLHLATLGHKLYTKSAPQHLLEESFQQYTPPYSLRHSSSFSLPHTHTFAYQHSPIYSASEHFNALPSDLRNIRKPASFINRASQLLLTYQCSCSVYPHPH